MRLRVILIKIVYYPYIMKKMFISLGTRLILLKRKIFPTKDIKKSNIRRILVVRLDLLGDVILSLPAIRAIKHFFPESEIYFLVREELIPLLKELGFSDIRFIPYGSPKRKDFFNKQINRLDHIRLIRKGHFDLFIDLCYGDTLDFALVTFFSGIPIRIGFDVGVHGILYTLPVKPPKTELYETDYPFYLMKNAGISASEKGISFSLDEDKQKETLRRFNIRTGTHTKNIMINIGVSQTNPLKKWFNEKFAELADLIAENYAANIFFLGTTEHKKDAHKIIGMMHSKARDLTGKTILIDLLYLINSCDLLITLNSGPMHLANLLKKQCIILSGPSGTKRWYKKTAYNHEIKKNMGCNRFDCRECRFDTVRCMEAISTEDVYKVCRKMLDRTEK